MLKFQSTDAVENPISAKIRNCPDIICWISVSGKKSISVHL